MKKDKLSLRCLFIFITIAALIVPVSFAESWNSYSIISISSLEMIIWEMAVSENRDSKFISLEYIAEEIERSGDTYDVILRSLIFLATEHIKNPIMVNGQIRNDFPDIRKLAAKCLGQLGTMEAREILLEMLTCENSEVVLQEVKNSLDNIQMN